ncbi:hypothetical protein GGH96_005990 [Coemansia sp. RSA 1972]|nr:hypothetical protein GGH96_005990 [Coemansia sp. RSA 1972]
MQEYTERDVELLRQAIEQAKLCTSVDSAYNVGAIIADQNGSVLSKGYSRQLPGNTHAEQCALDTLDKTQDLRSATLYTTMEPCSKRLSGNTPCVQRILDAGIMRVVVGVREPPNFVQCTGVELLEQQGTSVVFITELETECRQLNQHLQS